MKVTIDGKRVKLARVTFGTLAAMREMGVDIDSPETDWTKFLAALVALSVHCSFDEAVQMLHRHMQNGGDIKPILEAAARVVNDALKAG